MEVGAGSRSIDLEKVPERLNNVIEIEFGP